MFSGDGAFCTDLPYALGTFEQSWGTFEHKIILLTINECK
jgi:hypothetical protein